MRLALKRSQRHSRAAAGLLTTQVAHRCLEQRLSCFQLLGWGRVLAREAEHSVRRILRRGQLRVAAIEPELPPLGGSAPGLLVAHGMKVGDGARRALPIARWIAQLANSLMLHATARVQIRLV